MPGERILLVDDDESIRQVVSIFLADEGYQVVDVPNGLAALDVLQCHPPDVILLDGKIVDYSDLYGRDGKAMAALNMKDGGAAAFKAKPKVAKPAPA